MNGLYVLRAMLPRLYLYVGSAGSMATNAIAQFLSAVMLARYLGIEQFGHLITITAAATVGAQLCGLGTGDVMIRRVAREPALYNAILGHSLTLILISGVVLVPIITVALSFLVRISNDPFENLTLLLIFTFANVMLFRWVATTEQIFLARSQFWRANAIQLGFALVRMMTVITACVAFNIESLKVWILWYSAMHLVAAVACVMAVRQYGPPQWRFFREEFKLGIHQSTPQFFDMLQQNIDVLVLNIVATPVIVGNYGAASRMVRQSFVMIGSFNRILYPRLAVRGKQGVLSVVYMVAKYSRYSLALGVMTSIGLFIAAPLAVALFGKKFDDAVLYIRILCWLPSIIALVNISYDALGAADKHFIRANVYNICCIANAALIASLTYIYAIRGTFVAIYVSNVLILIAMWTTLLLLSRKEFRFEQSN
jgi:O-antigen/teichoic acid export membrane protein